MARITIPLEEAVKVFNANIQPGGVVKRVEPTAQGPKLIVSFPPILRETAILIRFLKYEGGVAYFSLDGMPQFPNIGMALRLPKGITVTDSMLKVQPDVLIATYLKLKGLYVSGVAWDRGMYIIDVLPKA
jgi:hypothetical protein